MLGGGGQGPGLLMGGEDEKESTGSTPCSGSALLGQPWESSAGHEHLRDSSPCVSSPKAWVSQEIQECLVWTVTEAEMDKAEPENQLLGQDVPSTHTQRHGHLAGTSATPCRGRKAGQGGAGGTRSSACINKNIFN